MILKEPSALSIKIKVGQEGYFFSLYVMLPYNIKWNFYMKCFTNNENDV